MSMNWTEWTWLWKCASSAVVQKCVLIATSKANESGKYLVHKSWAVSISIPWNVRKFDVKVWLVEMCIGKWTQNHSG